MKLHARHVVALFAVGLCPVAPSSEASPDSSSFEKVAPPEELRRLSAEWWQWSFSIPTFVNPNLDPTGANCMIGQRGPTWFLAAVGGGGTAIRKCTLPEGKELFFPVINNVEVNTPNVAGQGPEDLTVKEERLDTAPFIDNVSDLKVILDGRPIHNLHRVKSDVFEVTLPEDNLFDSPDLGNTPAGVYSPSVDDGIYALLKPLHVGTHTLHIHATSGRFSVDIRYTLVVVPVMLR